MVKQVIIVRKDVTMSTGKAIAQGAHASLEAVNHLIDHDNLSVDGSAEILQEWLETGHTKVVVGCKNLAELEKLIDKAELAKYLPYSIIKDAGRTEFDEPTVTCGAIGPAPAEEIDKITKRLQLY